MFKLYVPSSVGVSNVEVWRLLDLSGLTSSVRESRDSVLAGIVFVDGNPVKSLRQTIATGTNHTLEIRREKRPSKEITFFLVGESGPYRKTRPTGNPHTFRRG